MIVGDAFETIKQESLYAVVTQEQEIHGPPAYFTPDWEAARSFVARLAASQPLTLLYLLPQKRPVYRSDGA